MKIKITQKRLKEILGVKRFAPHAMPDGSNFKEPRCGDCFCTIQKVHSHNLEGEWMLKEILNYIDPTPTSSKEKDL